jgi:drug/metabolite transporter (DMT)-like permease
MTTKDLGRGASHFKTDFTPAPLKSLPFGSKQPIFPKHNAVRIASRTTHHAKGPSMLVYAKLVGSVFFWGATWISGRILAQDMGPFSAALLRFVTASAFLFLWSWHAGHGFPRLPRKEILPVAFLGLTGIFLYNAFFFTGLQTVPAGRAALIIASVPVVIGITSALFMGDKLTPYKILGTLLSLTGAAWSSPAGTRWISFTADSRAETS